jgi:hypothetical protein
VARSLADMARSLADMARSLADMARSLADMARSLASVAGNQTNLFKLLIYYYYAMQNDNKSIQTLDHIYYTSPNQLSHAPVSL